MLSICWSGLSDAWRIQYGIPPANNWFILSIVLTMIDGNRSIDSGIEYAASNSDAEASHGRVSSSWKGMPNHLPKMPSPWDVSRSEHGAVGSNIFMKAGLAAYSLRFLLTTLIVLGWYHSNEDLVDSAFRSNSDGNLIENLCNESLSIGVMCSPYPMGIHGSESVVNGLQRPLPLSQILII